MNEKNQDYLSVQEFANLVNIPVTSLRHYDREGVFVPAVQGNNGKFRYYSPMQITTVKMLRVLTEIGVPLKTIHDFTKERTPEKAMKLMAKYKRVIAEEIKYLQVVHSVINTFFDLLTEGMSAEESEITVCEMPETPIVLGEVTDFTRDEDFIREFTSFCTAPRRPKLNLSFPIGGVFSDMDTYLLHPSEPTHFFSLDPDGHERKEKGLYLTGYTRGYYGQTNDLPQRMAAYAKKHELTFNGPVYNLYLFDEISTVDPEQYLLQAAASVQETQHTLSRHPHRHFKNEF